MYDIESTAPLHPPLYPSVCYPFPIFLYSVTVTDKPRLRRMTMAQQEFYLKHPNGIALLKHVKNLSVGPDAVARREKEVRPTERANKAVLYAPSC